MYTLIEHLRASFDDILRLTLSVTYRDMAEIRIPHADGTYHLT